MLLLHYNVLVPILLTFHLLVAAKKLSIQPNLSPPEIIAPLHSLTVHENETSRLLEALLAVPTNAPSADLSVLQSKVHLENTTLAYLAFSARFASNPGAVVERITESLLLQVADLGRIYV
ncbi:hypothetical protein C8R43DRAFT_1118397 [Mycena crocata]|nr:hypothetical protein C8R43DRAFT_1118397 [Mycena crocata]